MPSSHIASHAYDAALKRMTITFHNGDVWNYANIPASLAIGMGRARSKGQYFHSFIRNRPEMYPATKVEKK